VDNDINKLPSLQQWKLLPKIILIESTTTRWATDGGGTHRPIVGSTTPPIGNLCKRYSKRRHKNRSNTILTEPGTHNQTELHFVRVPDGTVYFNPFYQSISIDVVATVPSAHFHAVDGMFGLPKSLSSRQLRNGRNMVKFNYPTWRGF
jgi:hypothetical protein